MLDAFSIFIPTYTSVTTIEMQPILSPWGEFSLVLVWGNFTTSFFLSLVALVILIYLLIKRGGVEKNFLVVWSVIILLAMIGQRRFAYYFTVNGALLTGYLSWQMLGLAGFREPEAGEAKAAKEVSRKRAVPKKRQFRITVIQVNMALALLIVFLLVYSPNVLFPTPGTSPTVNTASQARYAPSDGWVNSLNWLRENTPDPFGSPDSYYRHYQRPTGRYQYPDSAYGVMAWWDYGYWITRIGHRIPNANPSQDPGPLTAVASFFTSQDEKTARSVMDEMGSSYVIIDFETSLSKFWAIARWAGKEREAFFDTYYTQQGNQLRAYKIYYYPEFYRSVSTRLYIYNGQAVTPKKTTVISYEEMMTVEGVVLKVVTSEEGFDSYQEAESYLLSQESGNFRIVSDNPYDSPVPLEALEKFRVIHESENMIMLPNQNVVPAVKIFEYTGD